MSDALVVHQVLGAQAERAAERPAVGFDGASWTYGELADRAGRLAGLLAERGVGRGDVVGLLLERSPDYVAALWAVLRAGGVCLPLDPAEPAARRRAILAGAGARAVVVRAGFGREADLPDGTPAVALDWDAGELQRQSPPGAGDAVAPDDLAFVFATSGSTGQPKGVMLSHRTCTAFLPWVTETFALSPDDRHLFKTSVSFVSVLRQVVWPLATGGYAAVLPPGAERDLRRVARAAADEGVSILTFIPSALHRFLGHASAEGGVRHVLCGGEPITRRMQEAFFARFDAELHNLYALSEAPLVTHHRCGGPDDGAVAPIGAPIPGVDVQLVDAATGAGAPADGALAELHVGGQAIARGYANQPELTAETFGDGWLRTRDLVRADGGVLRFAGRADELLKVRGFRIEPGEVQAALSELPGVEHCHVTAVDVEDGDRRLVAYFTARDGEGPDRAALRDGLEARLPRYMIPSLFVQVDGIPLKDNGKVDRDALPSVALGARVEQRLFVPPRDDVEREIVGIWEDVLRSPQVGVADDFVELGGDSLLAMAVLTRVEDAFGIEMPLDEFVEAPTVEDVARLVRAAARA